LGGVAVGLLGRRLVGALGQGEAGVVGGGVGEAVGQDAAIVLGADGESDAGLAFVGPRLVRPAAMAIGGDASLGAWRGGVEVGGDE